MNNSVNNTSGELDPRQTINDIQLSNPNFSKLQPVSMDKIFESIKGVENQIDNFQKKIQEQTSPNVESHWYRLGSASADEVNASLDKVISFVKDGLKLVSKTDKSQSENIKNLCVLVSLLAITEAKLYYQFDELSSDSDTAIDIMAEYESELRDIADNSDDTQENVKRVAQTLGKILEEKNKEVINIKARFEKWKKDDAEQRLQLSKKIEDTDSALREELKTLEQRLQEYCNSGIENIQKDIFTQIKESEKRAFDKIDAISGLIDSKIEKLSEDLIFRTKKGILDSSICKITIGAISIAALICSILL